MEEWLGGNVMDSQGQSTTVIHFFFFFLSSLKIRFKT